LRFVGALALLRLNAAPLIRVVRSVQVALKAVARALLRAQHGARHDRRLAVGKVRHDLDHVQLAVRLALEDSAHCVVHVEIAVVGVLQLLDAERRRLVRRKVIRLVPLLNVPPHCLERVVQLRRHGESALFERSQGHLAVLPMSVLLGQRLDQDGQSHARPRHAEGEGAMVGRSAHHQPWKLSCGASPAESKVASR
jgi:hypothetical protein